jgi:hypothetical protein
MDTFHGESKELNQQLSITKQHGKNTGLFNVTAISCKEILEDLELAETTAPS